jgi:uncharacterized phage-associated protein
MEMRVRRQHRERASRYARPVTVSAHDVARVLREQLPGVGDKKVHKLLYLCQGMHLAMVGQPMFNESLHAYDMGPVVDRLWKDEKASRDVPPVDLDEAALNTVAFVVSRYGALTGRDLELLSHAQEPWIVADQARQRGGSDVVTHKTMQLFFASDLTSREDDTEPWPSQAAIDEWLQDAQPPDLSAVEMDDLDRLRNRAVGG